MLFITPVETAFNIVAQTEYIEGQITSVNEHDNNPFGWYFSNAKLCPLFSKNGCSTFSGNIALTTGIKFRIRRIANSDLIIVLESKDEHEYVNIHSIGKDSKLKKWKKNLPLSIHVINPQKQAKAGNSITLPLNVRFLKIGFELQPNKIGVQPLLRSGEIQILSRTILSNQSFFAGGTLLNQGDVFTVEKPSTDYVGVVVIDERPTMNISCLVRGNVGYIKRFLVDNIPVSASIFDRIRQDPILVSLTSIFSFLIIVLSTILASNLSIKTKTEE